MGFIPVFAVGVVVIVSTVSVALAVLKRFGILSGAVPTSDNEIGELRQTVDAMQQHLGELEERLDFTERLLAQYRAADRLGSPPQ